MENTKKTLFCEPLCIFFKSGTGTIHCEPSGLESNPKISQASQSRASAKPIKVTRKKLKSLFFFRGAGGTLEGHPQVSKKIPRLGSKLTWGYVGATVGHLLGHLWVTFGDICRRPGTDTFELLSGHSNWFGRCPALEISGFTFRPYWRNSQGSNSLCPL